MLTHIPFRTWCPHCIRGKARATYHKKGKSEKQIPIISLDYMYMETAESESRGMPILVAKGSESGWVTARVIPKKGKHVHAIKEMGKMLDWMGYKRAVIKTDQEPSIMEVKECIKAERQEEILGEESAVHDSRSNAEAERAIQSVQGQVRTIKDALEVRMGESLSPESNLVPWLVKHAADTVSRYHKGQDGLTAHRRLRGRDFRVDVCEFGEAVWYMRPGSIGKDKFDSKWEEGMWIGVIDGNGAVSYTHLTLPTKA